MFTQSIYDLIFFFILAAYYLCGCLLTKSTGVSQVQHDVFFALQISMENALKTRVHSFKVHFMHLLATFTLTRLETEQPIWWVQEGTLLYEPKDNNYINCSKWQRAWKNIIHIVLCHLGCLHSFTSLWLMRKKCHREHFWSDSTTTHHNTDEVEDR